MKTKIAILFGGQSHEYPVSLMSATSVLQNLDAKYDVYKVGITEDGVWYRYSGPIDKIINNEWINDPDNTEVLLSTNPHVHGFVELATNTNVPVDVIFPVLHGRNGEDGSIQGLCQLAGIPCISDDLVSCAIAIDKEFTHIVCESYGVPMARYRALHNEDVKVEKFPELFEELKNDLGLPFYVKPSREGSSFGAHKIDDYADFCTFVPDAFSYDDKILAEEFIEGHEVGCGVLGEFETGLMYEVEVQTEMYGYAEKYDGYKTNIYVPAHCLDEQQTEYVREMALKVYKALNCHCMARVDFFAGKRIIFNELNMIPGFTSHSLYPAMFTATGMTYTELLNKMIEITLKN